MWPSIDAKAAHNASGFVSNMAKHQAIKMIMIDQLPQGCNSPTTSRTVRRRTTAVLASPDGWIKGHTKVETNRDRNPERTKIITPPGPAGFPTPSAAQLGVMLPDPRPGTHAMGLLRAAQRRNVIEEMARGDVDKPERHALSWGLWSYGRGITMLSKKPKLLSRDRGTDSKRYDHSHAGLPAEVSPRSTPRK